MRATSPSEGEPPWAHSARPLRGIPRQPYSEHLLGGEQGEGVVEGAAHRAERCAREHPRLRVTFPAVVRLAAEWHDFGKLLPENQEVLANDTTGTKPLPLRHEDAGCAHLAELGHFEACLGVFAHHAGLPDVEAEIARNEFVFRERDAETGGPTFRRTNEDFHQLRQCHTAAVGAGTKPEAPSGLWGGLARRLALSCLVDADHTDTALNYRDLEAREFPALRAVERLEALRTHVENLNQGAARSERNNLRQEFFVHCASHAPVERVVFCDAPVGSGKTFAVTAHLLRVAIERRLDRLIVVMPFTNLINQAVRELRAALVLPGEDVERLITAHHHRAEFSDVHLRHLSQTWNAPIIVTTAVQFFETLAGDSTRSLRKLHHLPRSAVMIDEAHAAIPIHLWRQHWTWMEELARDWGCHFVLSSGTLPRFWETIHLLPKPRVLPSLVPDDLRRRQNVFEGQRLLPVSIRQRLTKCDLINRILDAPGPRVVVLNTLRAAAEVADGLRTTPEDDRVLHLSTALAPCDRERIVAAVEQRVRESIDNPERRDWTLVATSCVEAGLDLSFHTGFRQRASLFSLLQLGGRINRHAREYPDATIFDFTVAEKGWENPQFEAAQTVFGEMLNSGRVMDADLSTEFLTRLLQERDVSAAASAFCEAETKTNYPSVAQLGRVISQQTLTVVVDRDLADRLERGDAVRPRELQDHSVQIWASADAVHRYALRPLRARRQRAELYAWTLAYDPRFLGIMAGVLRLQESAAGNLPIL